MSATGLPVFDETLQLTNIWLNDVVDDLGPDRQRAYHALRAVLQTLRDRMTVEEAAHLSAQLPMLVRGFYYEGYRPAAVPEKHSREEFIQKVAERLQGADPVNPEAAVRSVFKLLSRHVTGGEIQQVRQILPKDFQLLWDAESLKQAAGGA